MTISEVIIILTKRIENLTRENEKLNILVSIYESEIIKHTEEKN